jgi:UDP-N-acetylglucosamine:LPS N-acetylglucosamine transferase
MSKPEICFATMAAGGSHVASATAMREAVEQVAPGRYDMRLRELLPELGFERFDEKHKANWRWMLRHPGYATLGRRFIDLSPRISQRINRGYMRAFAQAAAAKLGEEEPALVVVNHPLLSIGLTMAQREYGLELPVMTFQTTTLDTTSLWAVHEAQRIVLGSEVARDLMLDMGVPESIMDVVGYPVRRGFLREVSREDARQELGLAPERFTCLVSLGGEGVGGDPKSVTRALLAADFSVVVIAGRNEALAAELRASSAPSDRLCVEGFVDDMWRYLAAAEIVVGKTGPASVMEALSRGCPVIAPSRSGPNERTILAWLRAKGFGDYASSTEEVVRFAETYREDPARLGQVQAQARAYDFPAMFERIGRYIVHFAETGEPDPSLCGPGVS